jgi:hypothetical protein
MVVTNKLLQQIIQLPNLPTIHPKSVLRIVDYRGKFLATSDGWFVSY